jgi:hypothetical protein
MATNIDTSLCPNRLLWSTYYRNAFSVLIFWLGVAIDREPPAWRPLPICGPQISYGLPGVSKCTKSYVETVLISFATITIYNH